MKIKLFYLSLSLLFIVGTKSIAQHNPSFEEVLSLQSVSNPEVSPDGQHVLFTRQTVDWKENRYDTEIWISKSGGEPFQLTNNLKNSSYGAHWSPDGKWIAFLSNRSDKTQIQVVRTDGGEALQVTDTKGNISSFEWSPDGKQILFLQEKDNSKETKKREDKFGGYAVEDDEYSLSELWLIDFKPENLNLMLNPEQMEDSVFKASLEAKILIDSADFTITGFEWSPDGSKIAFDHQPDPLINTFFKSDIAIYDVASGEYKTLIDNPSADGFIAWSPDSKSILYQSSLADTSSNYYLNGNIFKINLDGSGKKQLAKNFDEEVYIRAWNDAGIFGVAWQKTNRAIVKVDSESGKVTLLKDMPNRVYDFSLSDDGKKIAYTAATNSDLPELYLADYPIKSAKKITNATKQIDDWSVANSEVVSWKSEDGAVIEGALYKPQDYDPSKKYPLMVVIHGGPTGISVPQPVPSYVYPIVQWLNKGALVLSPNYRGSAGYGEKFRSLNVRNLGVGDAWDVLSGVKSLEDKGMVDPEKVGAMGWSQGGYISAFLTTNSDRFKAISVGAGISNWMTYYVNTDIHPFTRQYLKGTPWSDKAIYEKTSPMTNINNASTPTLIQHGEFDKRVPPANAFELFQGLQDVGVETKLIIYKGFGHGISKPKERLAAMWHNWQWFGKYIWDEDIKLPIE
ncbi:MAG: peptidase S9 family protein [Thalassobius sp.]|nr:peptidase S9 family protein [Thalassovita sp.]